MAELVLNSSKLGNELWNVMMAQDLQPGDDVSYQLCKTIYMYHPLGLKMAESPITKAQSQQREISIQNSPEEVVREQFLKKWEEMRADEHIHNVHKTARIYGVASLALMVDGVPTKDRVDYRRLSEAEIAFNVLDPLNTAGSLVLNQDPNAFDFQKNVQGISVAGQPYHPSRSVVVMNEKPIYIGYSNSAFGYVGRSVYQRALFPMKSYVQTMVTDDMVTRKAGVLVAMLKSTGAIVTEAMRRMVGLKREAIKISETNNVISINAPDEKIESLNLQNLEGPLTAAKKSILENIAVAADMPAQMLNAETFAEGFGEGTEDAKSVAGYIDGVRREMAPTYAFMDEICMYRAWTPEFYKTIQARFPDDYGSVSFNAAFYRWKNAFQAVWPSLLTEPESEKVKVEETKFKTIVEVLTVLLPVCDPENKATLVTWAQDNLNENKRLFTSPLNLDAEALANYVPPTAEPGERNPDAGDETGAAETAVPMPSARADSVRLARDLRRPKLLTAAR